LRPFYKHCRLGQHPAHLVADDHPAHGRRDNHFDVGAQVLGNRLGQCLGQPFGPAWIHQHAGALQIFRAAEARREDEMTFEQSARSAKFSEDLVVRHGL